MTHGIGSSRYAEGCMCGECRETGRKRLGRRWQATYGETSVFGVPVAVPKPRLIGVVPPGGDDDRWLPIFALNRRAQ